MEGEHVLILDQNSCDPESSQKRKELFIVANKWGHSLEVQMNNFLNEFSPGVIRVILERESDWRVPLPLALLPIHKVFLGLWPGLHVEDEEEDEGNSSKADPCHEAQS